MIWQALLVFAFAAEGNAPLLTREQQEEFLRTAKFVEFKGAGKGITGSRRAKMTDGTITHWAHIQVVDEAKANFQGDRGTEINFRDSWKYNVAAYKLDKLLGLNMIPVSVERKVGGKSAAVTWWVDDVMMDEGGRLKQKLRAPDQKRWNDQLHAVRMFDQLIYNTDRNMQNLLITNSWDIWIIDHTRAFRLHRTLRDPKLVVRYDKALLDGLRRLDKATLQREMKGYLTGMEIDGILARRDCLLKRFDEDRTSRGEEQVVYEMPRRSTDVRLALR
jgi:hypothetical protein